MNSLFKVKNHSNKIKKLHVLNLLISRMNAKLLLNSLSDYDVDLVDPVINGYSIINSFDCIAHW